MKINILTIIFLINMLSAQLHGQSQYVILEQHISVNFNQTPVKEALTIVAQKGRFEFSYAGRIIDTEKKINLVTQNLTIRETLLQILGDGYRYQQRGEYLIIKKDPKTKQYISGYISDAKTGKRVPNVTVYDTQTLRSTATDANGYYTLKVAQRSTVAVAQLSYRDTILRVTESTPRFIKLDLELMAPTVQYPQKEITLANTAHRLSRIFMSPLLKVNTMNVKDTIHRRFQMSLVPYVGTNHSMSGNVTNDVGLNIIAGYARSNRVVEVSGVGSIIREQVSGVQVSGVYNIVRGNTRAVQIGGVFNTVHGTLQGVQVGGIWNFAQQVDAFNQLAGVANWAVKGNLNSQVAGVTNSGDSISGVQLAGVCNRASHTEGTQIAGVFNHANRIKGVQLAGVLNHAHDLKGIQIGVVNYADSSSGFQIGLVNYTKHNGFNRLELSANDINFFNIAYKSGQKGLYTTVIAGFSPKDKIQVWSYGAGLGTSIKLHKTTDLNFEVLHRHINVGSFSNFLQEWLQLGCYGNFRLNNRLNLVAGPNVNGLFIRSSNEIAIDNTQLLFQSSFRPRVFNEANSVRTYGWLGGIVALQLRV
jgi:CarboxypepD_reg-like domain